VQGALASFATIPSSSGGRVLVEQILALGRSQRGTRAGGYMPHRGRDPGAGPRLASREYPLDSSRGTDLGLTIVYAIVADSSGTIHVKSALKQGSTFAIYLPLVESTRCSR
jgi:hypothetical protein